jgi:hypothetical protein
MTDLNEDRTVAFDEHAFGAEKDRANLQGLVDIPKARLTCLDPSQVESTLPGEGVIHLVPGAEQTVGRGDTCTYPIGSRKLSRQHARVFAGVGAWGVEDLNSTNGVRVNEQKVKTAWLKHGDIVRFGPIPFKFEIERPDAAVAARAQAAQPAADGDGEHTMIFTGAQGARAAEAMIKAVREAEKAADEAPAAAIVPTTPIPRASQAQAQAAVKKGAPVKAIVLALVAVLVLAAVAGGVLYYPTFRRNQEIADVIERNTKVVDRVVARSRDAGSPADLRTLDDIKALQPAIDETWTALGLTPEHTGLANLYARARFLAFERVFSDLFNRGELKEASQKALDLRSRLDAVVRKLGDKAQGPEAEPLAATADLADLATIMITYRGFFRVYAQVGRPAGDPPALPTIDQINTVEGRKKDFIQYRKTYNQALSRDYRPFNALVQDVESRDFTLVSRWREFLGSGR